MRNSITYAGVNSASVGLVVEKFPPMNRPSRKFEKVSVLGRNGDIYFMQDAFSNIEQEYDIWSIKNNLSDIMEFLYPTETITTDSIINLEVNGYRQLSDTYEPNVIRLACVTSGFDVENLRNRYGKMTVTFDCRPERYMSDAFTVISKTSSGGYVTNNGRPSKPCIKIYGSGAGSVTVNGYVITVSDIPQYIHIDSDSQNCFKELSDANLNNLVTLASGFPILGNGRNTITWTGGVTKVDIVPRWWRL